MVGVGRGWDFEENKRLCLFALTLVDIGTF